MGCHESLYMIIKGGLDKKFCSFRQSIIVQFILVVITFQRLLVSQSLNFFVLR